MAEAGLCCALEKDNRKRVYNAVHSKRQEDRNTVTGLEQRGSMITEPDDHIAVAAGGMGGEIDIERVKKQPNLCCLVR